MISNLYFNQNHTFKIGKKNENGLIKYVFFQKNLKQEKIMGQRFNDSNNKRLKLHSFNGELIGNGILYFL